MNTGKVLDFPAQYDRMVPTKANPIGNKHGKEIYQHPQHNRKQNQGPPSGCRIHGSEGSAKRCYLSLIHI